MSDPRDLTIPDVSRTLLQLLKGSLGDVVTLAPPKNAASLLTLFLYKVLENPHFKNDDRSVRQGADGRLIEEPPPLTVDLHYLLTAHATGQNDPMLNAHAALSSAMRVFYDNAILRGSAIVTISDRGLTADSFLRITLNPISMEDMTRIWSVFPDTQYEISVTYVVTPVPIQSARTLGSAPVVDQIHDQGHLTAAPETER